MKENKAKAQGPKSSRLARQLIEAAVRKFGSEVKAAEALNLPNSTQLNKMRRGKLHDTAAMRLAILAAKARGRRAMFFIPRAREHKPLDPLALDAALENLQIDLQALGLLVGRPLRRRGVRGPTSTKPNNSQSTEDTNQGDNNNAHHSDKPASQS